GCGKLKDENEGPKNCQKLRLAALLHDVGHYPLSHPGEQVFQWVDFDQNVPDVTKNRGSNDFKKNLLLNAEKKHESPTAEHERLSKLIITHENSEIRKILEHEKYDPEEIARIFNAEDTQNPFHVQLMSSTLDCDRLDYMLRDAKSTGTSYGIVDLDYILRNLKWDKKNELICFTPKAITAIEHFITNRYFSYNIIYHKTTVGFELMAKALFYCMVMDKDFKDGGKYPEIVHSFADIEEKIKNDCDFLMNFNDEYFWYYLDIYKKRNDNKLIQKLIENLYKRKPLRPIYEIKTVETKTEGYYDEKYTILTKCLINNSDFLKKLDELGLDLGYISIAERKIKFEEMSHSIELEDTQKTESPDYLKLVKILQKDEIRELVTLSGSIVKTLSQYKPCISRLYALVDKNSDEEKELKSIVGEILTQ
nr:HD domain-containing protein [candidate division Zixibacteria bacterium]